MMKKRGLSKRILAFMLSLMMVIALVPMNAITVKAEGVPNCPHCGGTGLVCSKHAEIAHARRDYSNINSCKSPCKDSEMGGCGSHMPPLTSECDYCKRVSACKHSSATSYNDADFHGKTCDDCGAIIDKESHTDTNNDGICDTCRYSSSNVVILPENNNDEFKLNICNIPSEGGRTYCENMPLSYSRGTSATFTAKPNSGYRFKGWYAMKSSNASGELGTCLSSEETYKITPSAVDTYKECEYVGKNAYSVYIAAVYEETIPRKKVITSAIDTNSNGFEGEGCENLLDSNTDTKWCCSFDGETFVVIKASEPVIISNYTITTAGDTSQYKDRNPKSWTLLACNDYNEAEKKGTWEEIDSISNGDMPNKNTTAKTFNISSTKKYQYYKWNVTSIVGGSTLQVSEFVLNAFHSFENNDANTHKCSFCNTTGEHDFSDGTCKGVCTVCGASNTSGTHDFSVKVDDATHKCANCDATESHDLEDEIVITVNIDGKEHQLKYDDELDFYFCQDEGCDAEFEPGYYNAYGSCEEDNDELAYVLLAKLANKEDLFYDIEYDGCTQLQVVDFRNIEEIDHSIGFKDCKSLQTVNLGRLQKLTSSEDKTIVFDNCQSLQTVNLGRLQKLTSSGEKTIVFNNCQSLQTVDLGSLKYCEGTIFFENCQSLQSVDLKNLTEVVVPKYEGGIIFNECGSLETIDLGSLKNTGGVLDFSDCDSLRAVDLGKLVNCGGVNYYYSAEAASVTLHEGDPCGIKTDFWGCVISYTSHTYILDEEGHYVCSVCGHEGGCATGNHDFSVNVNETTHKCANCDATGNHNFTDADGNPSNTCIVCGYRNIEENIELYVYGIKVTEENADDINGDGKTSFDKESSTLYLKGTSDEIGLHENVVIYSSLDTLNIELEGDTFINSETAAYGIYFAKEDSNNTLDLNGHDLTINVGNMDNRVARNGDSAGIYFGKNTLNITGDSVNDVLDITSGTVTSSDYSSCGIYNNEDDGTATLNIDTIKLNICCVGSNGYSCGIYILHGELNCYSGDIGISNTESGADGTNALFMAYGGNCRITGNTKVTISLVETDKGEGLVGICGGNITIGDNADVNVDINPRHSNYDSYGVWVKKLTIQDNAKVSINGAISSDYFGLHLLYFQNKKIDEEEFDFKGGHLLIKSQAKCYAVGTFYKGIINMAEGYHLYKLDENGSKSNFDYRGTYRDSDSWSNIFNSSGYSLSAGQALIIDKCEEHLFLQDSENNNHYCKYCGITASHLFDVEDTEAIGAGKSNATCTEAAKYYKSCACGLVSTDEADLFESGEPLGHDYSVPMDGDNHKCSRCDSQGIHDFINADGTNAGTEECIDCGVKNIAYTDLAINISNLIYTSEIQIPEVEIKNGDTVLVKDTDYTVTVEGKSDVGIYELKVTGANKYRGEINKKWSIIAGDGLWCADIPDQVYTGKAIKPSLEVYCDGIKLIANKDYTLTYKNNVKVAASDAKNAKGGSIAPSVTITGKGNYADKKTVNFAIVPCSIDTAACEDITVAKTGKNIKINPVVTLDGKKLKAGTDYVVSTSTDVKDAVVSYKEAETYNLYAVGKGSYTGYVTFNFTITESILASKVTIAKIADQKYDDGKEVKPAVKITYNKKDVADKFDVTYEKNTEIGTATVIATAKADSGFTGSKKATFKITGKSITTAKLGSNGKGTIPAATYTGSAYEPELDLYAGGEQLVKNVDYTVAYSKNVNAGSATATVIGKGSYTGTKKFTFKINKYDATKDEADIIKINNDEPIIMVYSKGGVVPKPVVTMNGTVLKEKTDYTLSYANNKSVADTSAVNSKGKSVAPTVNVIFKGNFSGKKSVAFNIEAKDIRVTSLVIADKAVGTKANAWKQTAVAITDTDGKKLVAGTDFNKTFKYYSDSECKNEITDSTLGAGTTVYVQVTGLNNYISEIVGSYRISMTNISSVSASIATREYTGSEICPAAEEITVTVGKGSAKKTLVAGTDYEIVSGSYTKNINKGTATVTIRGINDYYGTKVVKYTIGAKKFLWWKL